MNDCFRVTNKMYGLSILDLKVQVLCASNDAITLRRRKPTQGGSDA